jgi:hypothetical protein
MYKGRLDPQALVAIPSVQPGSQAHGLVGTGQQRGTDGAKTSRDFVPWRFSVTGRRSAWIVPSRRRKIAHINVEHII